jgi:nucleotide-binding universal stress UspA family protein
MNEGLVLVVGIDYTEGSADAIREAVSLARRGTAGQVHVVHVLSESEGHVRRHPDEDAEQIGEDTRKLHEFARAAGASVQQSEQDPPGNIGVHVRLGDPVKELHRAAVQLDADMIFIGPHSHGLFKHRAAGGTARRIIEQAHCPVVVARRKSYDALEQVPEIEPPCPDCVQVRHRSGGQQWWCEMHSRPREPFHVYSGSNEIRWTSHDSDAVPTGYDFNR